MWCGEASTKWSIRWSLSAPPSTTAGPIISSPSAAWTTRCGATAASNASSARPGAGSSCRVSPCSARARPRATTATSASWPAVHGPPAACRASCAWPCAASWRPRAYRKRCASTARARPIPYIKVQPGGPSRPTWPGWSSRSGTAMRTSWATSGPASARPRPSSRPWLSTPASPRAACWPRGDTRVWRPSRPSPTFTTTPWSRCSTSQTSTHCWPRARCSAARSCRTTATGSWN